MSLKPIQSVAISPRLLKLIVLELDWRFAMLELPTALGYRAREVEPTLAHLALDSPHNTTIQQNPVHFPPSLL